MSQVPTSAEARVNLYNTLQLTQTWSSAAGLLHDWGLALEALAANESVPAEIAAELSSMKTNFSVVPSHANEAILCSDVVDAGNMTMRDGFDAIVSASEDVSSLFGPQWGNSGNACFAWPVRAVERYTGPWDNKPKNPVLIIGNTVSRELCIYLVTRLTSDVLQADPITPFKNAQLMADLLGDSAVLVRQDGLGHTSLAEQSSCTIGIIYKYFTEGSVSNPQLVSERD